MAYENVDVESAKRAINNCLNNINHSASDNILSTLPSSNEWIVESKSNFLGAVDKLVNTRYDELKAYLEKCLVNLDNIQKYKDLQSQSAGYAKQISDQKYALNEQKNKYNRLTDKSTDEAKRMKQNIDNMEREVNELERLKNNNSSDMSRINIDI